MCGIAGAAARPGVVQAALLEPVRRMTARMVKRGPDAEGIWSADGVVLGHRRLAIIDLNARANQPMGSADGRYTIVFNGEIYNFRELRSTLKKAGVALRTNSDTEVLLALFARQGARMLEKLRGMFALAIWDTQRSELFLARDPYGIKPLYYAVTQEGVLFASQVKALIASRLVSTVQEPAGLVGFYLWGSVPEPWTLLRDVRALPAGHSLTVRNGAAEAPLCWHDIRSHWRSAGGEFTVAEVRERVRQAVADSVRSHLVADVPVSVFLSGGIDSAAVAALAADQGAAVQGITIGFDEFAGRHEDEVPVAAAIAAHYGLPHHVRWVAPAEFTADLPGILDAMDLPSIDGVNTWFASKAAAERGYKVVLSGVGGDELFCGYKSFRDIPRIAALGAKLAKVPGARALLGASCALLAKGRAQPKLVGVPAFAGSLEGAFFLSRGLFLPDELSGLLPEDVVCEGLARLGGTPPGMARAGARDDSAAVGLMESTHYLRNQLLRDSDWASMGHSLELRTPLVDAKLLETLGPCVEFFANGAGKAMLAGSPEKALPEWIVKRRKSGFTLPMTNWLRADGEGAAAQASDNSWARRWARAIVDGSLAHA